jgi:hypothetical protein
MKGTEELRCYTFTLYQLSSIQQGIQAGHAAVELMTKYPQNPAIFSLNNVQEWAHYWKTMVLLNGGDLSELRELLLFFSMTSNPYMWAPFYESEESLDGIPTSIAIILPERIFKASEALRRNSTDFGTVFSGTFSGWESDLIIKISQTSLAR